MKIHVNLCVFTAQIRWLSINWTVQLGPMKNLRLQDIHLIKEHWTYEILLNTVITPISQIRLQEFSREIILFYYRIPDGRICNIGVHFTPLYKFVFE